MAGDERVGEDISNNVELFDINKPESVKDLSHKELADAHWKMHQLYSNWEQDKEVDVEAVKRFHEAVVKEMIDRGIRHYCIGVIDEGVPCEAQAEAFKEPERSGDVRGEEITLDEVLEHLKDFKLKSPVVMITGGIVNHGKTTGDIDILILYPHRNITRDIPLEFRISRSFPKELQDRIHFVYDSYHGPFTSHIPIFDLVAVRRTKEEIVKMQSEQISTFPMDDKFHTYVLPAHFRGKTVHLDLRIKVNKSLEGFTLFAQKEAVITKPVMSLKEAKAWLKKDIFKDIVEKCQVVPKQIHAVDWLGYIDQVVQPGGVGATKQYPGVFAAYDKGLVEIGVQKPDFKEFFFHGKYWRGRYVVRLLPNPYQEQPKFIWLMWKPEEQVPYVISKRAIQKEWLPPKGISCLPVQTRTKVPKELRYWLYEGKEALGLRRQLVEKEFK